MPLLFRLRSAGCISDAALYVLLAFMPQYNTISVGLGLALVKKTTSDSLTYNL